MPYLNNRTRSGFTLVELLISVAIMGFLTAFMFFNYATEKNRSNLKTSADRIQTYIQEAQTNAQSGIKQGLVLPNGYGLVTAIGSSYARLFYESGSTATDIDGLFNGSDGLVKNTLFPTGVSVVRYIVDGTTYATSGRTLQVYFSTPNATAKISYWDNVSAPILATTSASIIVYSQKLNICYAINVTRATGTVSRRELQPGSCL